MRNDPLSDDPNVPVHDRLLRQLQKYFISNQRWEESKSMRSGRMARTALKEIRRLSKIRHRELMEQSKPAWKTKPNIIKYNQDRGVGSQDNDT